MQAFYLPADGRPGQRFCLYHEPGSSPARAAVVYVHPWAEEMNKSRRMAALQSRQLAAIGCAVLQIDLHGCGDSSGDFADASWESWIDDVVQAARWLAERHAAPLWFWGLRAGALLCTAAAQRLVRPSHLLLWQPATSGKVLLQQFLRLKAAADLHSGESKKALEAARSDLREGRTVDLAGYALPSALALPLEMAVLDPPPTTKSVLWLEVSSREAAALLPGSAARVQAWKESGIDVVTRVVKGVAFWQTQEIEDAPALLEASTSALRERAPAVPA